MCGRFVSNNAWNIVEVGFGVTGLVLAGLAVGRYVSLLAKLAPIYVKQDANMALPAISVRTATSSTTAHSIDSPLSHGLF